MPGGEIIGAIGFLLLSIVALVALAALERRRRQDRRPSRVPPPIVGSGVLPAPPPDVDLELLVGRARTGAAPGGVTGGPEPPRWVRHLPEQAAGGVTEADPGDGWDPAPTQSARAAP